MRRSTNEAAFSISMLLSRLLSAELKSLKTPEIHRAYLISLASITTLQITSEFLSEIFYCLLFLWLPKCWLVQT